jgi:hypothetical protein
VDGIAADSLGAKRIVTVATDGRPVPTTDTTAGTRCPPSRRPNLILHLINKPPKITQRKHFPDTF